MTFATAGGRYMARVFYFARVRNFSGDTDNADVISSCVYTATVKVRIHIVAFSNAIGEVRVIV